MKMVIGGSCALLLALTTRGHALKAASSCESLSSLALPNTSITLAQMVPAGAFTLPGTGPAAPQFSQLPTFCRVAATLTPSSDSDIKIEVWMPAADWNGKFQAVGNGGWAGTISYGALASALQEGYATVSTDTGHAGANASFAIGHPEKVIDFAYRAVLAACDAIDGVKDGLLTDPQQCQFDPATLLCRGADRDDCLTAQQIEAVKMGYAPARRKTGELIYPGLVPGGETGWAMLTG